MSWFKLREPMGPSYRVDPIDIKNTKRALNVLGYYNVPSHRGIDDWTDDATATFFQEKRSCAGGISSLHVYASGRASPCKLLPHISVNLLTEDLSRLSRLYHHPGAKPVGPGCENCALSPNCLTCAPVYTLYKRAGYIPRNVCNFRPVATEGECGAASRPA